MASDRAFCDGILPGVSRTFALAIRLLPPQLSHQVGVSYLLCRMIDTIEDDTTVDIAVRRRMLAEVVAATGDRRASLADLPPIGKLGNERTLMAGSDAVLRCFHAFPPAVQQVIRPQVSEMAAGMARWLSNADPDQPIVADLEGLRQYCHYVAGTVGHLLEGLFHLDRGQSPPPGTPESGYLAERFGLGLQLTNIVRDVADDRIEGRNFVPLELWQEAGLPPGELFAAGRESASWQVITPLLSEALAALDDALEYVVRLPRNQYRVRLFCLISLFLSCRTLALVDRQRRLGNRTTRVKVTRRQVYLLLALAAAVAPFNTLVRSACRMLMPSSGSDAVAAA